MLYLDGWTTKEKNKIEEEKIMFHCLKGIKWKGKIDVSLFEKNN